MVKGKDTGLLSETLFQVILALGLASASHVRFTTSVSFTIWLSEMLTMSGGSGNKEKPYSVKKVKKKKLIMKSTFGVRCNITLIAEKSAYLSYVLLNPLLPVISM